MAQDHQTLLNSTFVFIMPFWASESSYNPLFLKNAVESIFAQTDENWHLVIIDDNSTSTEALNDLKRLGVNSKITILTTDKNSGPGESRNIGIRWAMENNFPVIMYNDSDDCSHPSRVEVARNIFSQNANVSLVYSTFSVIDELDNPVNYNYLGASIKEILDSHSDNPPIGSNAWVDIGIRTGYTNLTSSTNVLTDLAYNYPFPKLRVAEDSYLWLIYSAAGDEFYYTPDIPSLYRIPSSDAGSSSRTREGGVENFIRQGVQNLVEGFSTALNIALKNHKITIDLKDYILIKFYIRMAVTLDKENLIQIRDEQFDSASRISSELTSAILKEYNYNFSKGINIA